MAGVFAFSSAVGINNAFAEQSRLEQLLKNGAAPKRTESREDKLYKDILDGERRITARLTELEGYRIEFEEIKKLAQNEKYDDVSSKTKELASRLEREKTDTMQILLRNVKEFNYTKNVFVPEVNERRLVKAGSPPEYIDVQTHETKSVPHFFVAAPLGFVGGLLSGIASSVTKNPKIQKDFNDGFYDAMCKKEKVVNRKGTEPVYQNVNIPAHYKKIQINPYSGTETPIGKFPIR